MNSYLSIAEEALRRARRPLTSREIVEVAYRNDLVPTHLYGKTQHKTVGARLSEDILKRRDRSQFYRSEPGRFFLREFLSDVSIPAHHRTPILARRRQRELRQGAPLMVQRTSALLASQKAQDGGDMLPVLSETCDFHYQSPMEELPPGGLQVWSYVMFMRDCEVLTYRHGRYREGRDTFLKRRSVGFFAPVVDRDFDLFDSGDQGIRTSAIRAIAFDLDLPHVVFKADFQSSIQISDALVASDDKGKEDFLAVVSMVCPSGFEPLTRRLAINDLDWMRLDVPVNHVDDFDPWSRIVIERAQHRRAGYGRHS